MPAKKRRYLVMGSDYGEAASTLPSQQREQIFRN
jgi:hypothetical protein